MENINKNSKVKPCKAHYDWVTKVCKIGREQGDEAAQEWMKKNPYIAE